MPYLFCFDAYTSEYFCYGFFLLLTSRRGLTPLPVWGSYGLNGSCEGSRYDVLGEVLPRRGSRLVRPAS